LQYHEIRYHLLMQAPLTQPLFLLNYLHRSINFGRKKAE
jgi:hypothetical protein